MENVKLIECPRDAWQGLPDFIPTEYKAEYLKELVLAGFKHIDAVSFVSPKHVKQMADSEEVMTKLSASLPAGVELPEIIGIVVNEKGLERALATPSVSTIGYPYSISAYFRRANANMTRDESRLLVEKLKKETAEEKILAAYEAGCRRFDSALTGLGGCPFAGDNLVGNIATEDVLAALRKAGADPGIDSARLTKALEMTNEIRAKYAHAPFVN